MTKLQPLLVSVVLVFAVLLLGAPVKSAQNLFAKPQTVTLVARRQREGFDNYTRAAFSFKYGANGDSAQKIVRNNWDVLFGNSLDADIFDVTMVTDDCSRIRDLGKLDWSEIVNVPVLPAYTTPTREPSVQAVVGHIYEIHVKDRDNDHYALFRVESLAARESVTISWKLAPSPE